MKRLLSTIVLPLFFVANGFSTDKLDITSTKDADGFYTADAALEFEWIISQEIKETMASCVLQYSFDKGNNWSILNYYDGSVNDGRISDDDSQVKIKIKIKYADLLPQKTDVSYIENLAKEIWFKIKYVVKTREGNKTILKTEESNIEKPKFLVSPKYSTPIIYRTTEDTDPTMFHIGIIPENFNDLDWSKYFELLVCESYEFELKKKGGFYEAQVKDIEAINDLSQITCKIQAINNNNVSEEFIKKINPAIFSLQIPSPSESPIIVTTKPPVEENLSQYYINTGVSPFVSLHIKDEWARAPYKLYKGKKETIESSVPIVGYENIKLTGIDSISGSSGINSLEDFKRQINEKIDASDKNKKEGKQVWWEWESYYQQRYNEWAVNWTVPNGYYPESRIIEYEDLYVDKTQVSNWGFAPIVVLPIERNTSRYDIYFFCFRNGLYSDNVSVYKLEYATKAYTDFITEHYDNCSIGEGVERDGSSVTINKGGVSVLIHIDGNYWYCQSGAINTSGDGYNYNWGNDFYGNYYVYGDDDDLTDHFVYVDSNGYKLLVKKKKSEYENAYDYYEIDFRNSGRMTIIPFYHSGICGENNGGYNYSLTAYYDGEYFHYAGKKVRQLCSASLINAGYDNNIKSYYVEYSTLGPCRINMLPDSPPEDTLNSWKTEFANQKEKKCFADNAEHKLNIITNRTETYTLVDKDGGKTEFTVPVKAPFFDQTATSVTGIQQENGSFLYNVTAKFIDMGTIKYYKDDNTIGSIYYKNGNEEQYKDSIGRDTTFTIKGLTSYSGKLIFRRNPAVDNNKDSTLTYGVAEHHTPQTSVTFCSGKTDNKGGVIIIGADKKTTESIELWEFKEKTFNESNMPKSKEGLNPIKTHKTSTYNKDDKYIYAEFKDLTDGNQYVPIINGKIGGINYIMTPITISSAKQTFKINDLTTDNIINSSEIGQTGSVKNITVENAIQDVTWKLMPNDIAEKKGKAESWNVSGLPANKYTVEAYQLNDDYCTASNEFNIEAPAIVGKIDIKQSNDTLYYSLVGDIDKNKLVTDYYFKINKNEDSIATITKPVSNNTNYYILSDDKYRCGEYKIILVYKTNTPNDNKWKSWEVWKYNINYDELTKNYILNNYTLSHDTIYTIPYCYEDALKLELKSTNNNPNFKIEKSQQVSSQELKKDKQVEFYQIDNEKLKAESKAKYTLKCNEGQDITDETNKNNPITSLNNYKSSHFDISFSRSKDYEITGLNKYHIDALSGDVFSKDFLCSYSTYADIEIKNIKGGFMGVEPFTDEWRTGKETESLYYILSFEGGDNSENDFSDKVFSINSRESTIYHSTNPGKYTIKIYDIVNGHTCDARQIDSKIITRPSEIVFAQFVPTDPICELTASGKIQIKASGGSVNGNGYKYCIDTIGLDYKWDTTKNEYGEIKQLWPTAPRNARMDSTIQTDMKIFGNLYPGKYRISVFDSKQCVLIKDDTLRQYHNPYVMAAHFDSVICYGEKNGQIIIDSVEGSYYTTYYQLFKCNEDGVYVPYRKDTINNSFVATIPTDSSLNDRTWKYYADTVKKRIPPLWEIDSLYKGYYKIALTDVNGCTTSVAERDLPFGEKSGKHYPIEVKEPKLLQMSIIHQDTIIHEYGKKGGTVEVLVAGGNKGRFNIYIDSIVSDSMVGHAAWDIHETFKDIFMPDTTHKLYVQDHKECTDSVITGFMRQPDSPLMVEGIPHPAWCNGAEGSIKIIAKGGWGKYRYSCNLTGDTVAMRQPFDSVAASLTSDSIQVGGGLYVLTLIDSAGVMVYDTVLVTTPPALKADNLSRAAYCGSDGVIAVDISGGTAPYKIENDFGQETFRTAGGITAFSKSVPAGSYTVYIKDTNDCRFNVPVSIADSSVVVSIKRQYPTMRQYANGRLEAVAQRGHAPYTFLWTNRNTGETCANAVWNNVMAGTYSLVVSDGSGCEKEGEIAYLATNGDLPLTIDAVEGETAPNAKNGWARFTSDTSGFSKMMLHSALGGDIDVIGNISNQLNFELTGLAPDSYVLECMLPEGEVRYAEFTIAKYEPIVLLVNNINHASQPDASDGSATLQITGGVAPYVVQMLHNDVFYDDTVLNGRQLVLPQLSAGTYAAIVIDKYGKRENTRFIIKEPDSPMQLTAESVQGPSCYGYSNGQIWLKAQGGWGDYEYALAGSDYSRTTMYGNRSAESYTFIAIDAKGVTDTLTVELSQPEPLRAGVAKVDSVSCFGLFDGGVTFDITGGTAPYYVEFDSLFTKPGNYIGSLNGGLHTFRFTDDKMCASDDDGLEVDVPQPEKLVIANDSVTPTTCNTDNGKIDIVIAGGIAPYTVKWKEDGLTVARLQGRTSIDSLQQLSLYSVVAVDANNCETEDRSYRMNRSSGPRINKVLTLPVLCYGDATGTAVIDSADITTAVPFAPFRIEWPNGQNAMSVNDLTAGAHLVTIIDTNNCVNSTRFEVGSPNPVEIKMIGSRDATCYGYTDGLISTLTLGGVGSYHYLWNTGDTLPDLDSIGKGSYTIVATDFNNCHDTATFSIGQPDSLHVEIGEESVLMCPGNTYEFIATSGFKTYCWVLNDSILSEKSSFIASDGGEYYLEATYGANCISRDTVTISIGDDLLEADFYMASDAAVDTALALVELSNMQIDSLHWEFSPTDFVVMDSADYELYLKPLKIGQHEITLWAYSGGCVSYITKQVEISELADTASNINLGYNPLIKSVDVMPNPTKGRFSIRVKLREDYNAEVSVSSAGQGKPVERRELSGKSEYEESFDLSNAGDGVYILRIVAGSEQRVAKVLIAK